MRKAELKMSLIRAVANTSWGWRKKDLKKYGQHTSVVSLTTLLVDGNPDQQQPRRKVRASAEQGTPADNWSVNELPLRST